MSTLVVPALEKRPWPTLGPQVCDFIEDCLVHGPGDIRGEPARIDDETRGLIYRMYEVYPRSHSSAGRRRFKRVGLSLRKGTAKTEKAAWIAACELHPEAPVRCDGWRKVGKRYEPVGVGVKDPYIPMVAYTEEQTEDLAYAALFTILSEGPLANDFDIGLERIARLAGDGKAVPLASAPDSRDGARTTFQHFDETHRFILARLKEAHQTMQANIPKRRAADPWSLETTTAPVPGEGSVAEGTMDYAKEIAAGARKDSRLFFFHREASDEHDLTKEDGVRAAVEEASGPVAAWSDIDGIVDLWRDPQTDRSYFERVWLNRTVQASRQAYDLARFRNLADPEKEIPAGELITIGFDGSRFKDATGIVGTHVESGHQFVIGLWERPPRLEEWEVPEDEVDAAMRGAFETWQVWRAYCDPPYWESMVDTWAGRWGEKTVVRWFTHRHRPMASAVRAYATAIRVGSLSHDGHEGLVRHVGASCRVDTNLHDEEGERLYLIAKERRDSPNKIDLAVAACLSWQARGDAVAAGAEAKKSKAIHFL